MNVSDYIVKRLIQDGVTDVFGIPGGVVLDFLYALEKRSDVISVHLNYHEQSSVFASCGYARAGGIYGVVYATRGPGFTNLISGIAEAYCDSIPLVVITAHSNLDFSGELRMPADQELDTVNMVARITKYCARIDSIEDVSHHLNNAVYEAGTGRKGPVLLDFYSKILGQNYRDPSKTQDIPLNSHYDNNLIIIDEISTALSISNRPVLLLGDGLRCITNLQKILSFSELHNIPILSSRYSQDLYSSSSTYCGYIGSHGLRYSNFILSKADLLIVIGNRLSFPAKSESYSTIINNAKILRLEIDESEISQDLQITKSFHCDADIFFLNTDSIIANNSYVSWMETCRTVVQRLNNYDMGYPVDLLSKLLVFFSSRKYTITSDVGNNEFWLCRAYAHSRATCQILFSKSFGSLGSSIGKAIGAYYKTRRPVVCFAGDQGFQMNIQELQYIVQHNLPIMIILLNNYSSGMIKYRELRKYGEHYVHTTLNDGYSVPDFLSIVASYGIESALLDFGSIEKLFMKCNALSKPCFYEIQVDDSVEMIPFLPKGEVCQNLFPPLDSSLYEQINKL